MAEGMERERVPHDVLDVGRVAELKAGGVVAGVDLGAAALGFEQEGVAVVPEEHTGVGQPVDGGALTAQTGADQFAEARPIVGQHLQRHIMFDVFFFR